jgi:hypothetical protein
MVIFQNPDGDPGYNQFESVEDAVSFVEKIRNEQGIDSIRIFELNEVKFELKPYFKVELQALNPGAAPSRPQPAPAPAPAAAPAGGYSSAAPAPAPVAPSAPAPEPASTSPFSTPAPETPSFDQPAPAAAAAPAAPAAPVAPVPPADQPADESQPTRRGLFGR